MICICEIHGNLGQLEPFRHALQTILGVQALEAASVVSLGDFCDQEPHKAQVSDLLIALWLDLKRRT